MLNQSGRPPSVRVVGACGTLANMRRVFAYHVARWRERRDQVETPGFQPGDHRRWDLGTELHDLDRAGAAGCERPKWQWWWVGCPDHLG